MASWNRSKPCACGCGQVVNGQRSSRRFYTDACRVKAHRGRAPNGDSQVGQRAEKPLQRGRVIPRHGAVTLTDTIAPEVHCPCGRPLPKVPGPLPVVAYCSDCVADRRCPCYGRPAWHQWGRRPQRVRVA